MKRRTLLLVVCAAGGLILGALLGHVIGVSIRSDNMPFFDALGGVIGLAAGLVAAFVASRRPGGGRL